MLVSPSPSITSGIESATRKLTDKFLRARVHGHACRPRHDFRRRIASLAWMRCSQTLICIGRNTTGPDPMERVDTIAARRE